ncbi:MAG: hypothetical protein ACPKQO_05180 [Nitrososphaeraceae archaeon]
MIYKQEEYPRIVLYSADFKDFEQIYRNLLIAKTFSNSDLKPNILVISGAQTTPEFLQLNGIDYITLPKIGTEINSSFLEGNLKLLFEQIIELRRQIIYTIIKQFDPEIFIVDSIPWGLGNELDISLDYLYKKKNTYCILGIPDVWDEPSTIRKEWHQKLNYISVKKYYYQIWVYGYSSIYDVIDEYGIPPNISNKIRYTGYLCHEPNNTVESLNDENTLNNLLESIIKNKFVLCIINEVDTDVKLATEFIGSNLPKDVFGIVLVNCKLNKNTFHRLFNLANKYNNFYLIDYFSNNEILIKKAICIVSSGTYSVISKILSYKNNALIIPKINSNKEQFIRTLRLNEHGVFDIINYDDVSKKKISFWIKDNINKKTKRKYDQINKEGLKNVDSLFTAIITKTKMTINNNDINSDRMQ